MPVGVYYHADEQPSFVLWDVNEAESSIQVYKAILGEKEVFRTVDILSAGKPTATHQHDYIELLYVVCGSFTVHIAGKDYCFSEGDIALINRGTLHYDYLPDQEACIVFFIISDALFDRLFSHSIHSPYENFLANLLLSKREDYSHIHGVLKSQNKIQAETQTFHTISTVLREIVNTQPGSTHIVNGSIIRLFYLLVLEYRFDLSSYSQADMRRVLYQNLVKDIQLDCRAITIDKLQNKYFFNRDYFNRLIKENSGYTFQQLRQNIRLEQAQKLLLETEMRIEDVALEVGYENLGFFYRLFSEKYGMKPREYRIKNS